MTLTMGQPIHYLCRLPIFAAFCATIWGVDLPRIGAKLGKVLGIMRFGFSIRPGKRHARQSFFGRMSLAMLGLIFLLPAGCASNREFAFRTAAANLLSLGGRPVVEVKRSKPFKRGLTDLLINRPAVPSERTNQFLRRQDWELQYKEDPDDVIKRLEELVEYRPAMEAIHGLAEIAEIQARYSARNGDLDRATQLYATAVVHSYKFLFDTKLDLSRNAFDPQFRTICDIYNRSLGELLREVCARGELHPNATIRVGTEQQAIEFEVRIEGRWQNQDFEKFELVNDYQTSGIDNRHHRYGLGVPLIAIRKRQPINRPYEKYYPPDLTMPMTAFVHMRSRQDESLLDDRIAGPKPNVHRAVLTLYDPLEQSQVQAESTIVPLESDFTTPLAYALKDPLLNKGVLATASLLNPNYVPESYGIFMLEPYDPNKIPVVMAHGLWSTPVIWVHMFNDLRANREIHKNYQFWFYSYPTGQPFWISAQQMRTDLAELRNELDPQNQSQSLKQMILVGHSMGGLISHLQTVESEDHFWNIISDEPIETLEGDPDSIQSLHSTFYFHPNPNIDRVITIATPLRGSKFANSATRWVGQRIIQLPDIVTRDFQQLASQNKAKLKSTTLLTTTSVDSLAPDNPVFQAIAVAKQIDGVKTNNIVGRVPRKFGFNSADPDDRSSGDGVVSVSSAVNSRAESQIFVPEEHTRLPQHPGCIYEVRRILLENIGKDPRASRTATVEPATDFQPVVERVTRLEPLLDPVK